MIDLKFKDLEINLKTNRLIIFLLDALRYDVFVKHNTRTPDILLKYTAAGNYTLPCLEVWADLIEKSDFAYKSVITGGGYASMVKWPRLDYFNDKHIFPLFSPEITKVLSNNKSLKQNFFVLIHDYYIHNWWEEIGFRNNATDWIPKKGWKEKNEKAFQIYNRRVDETLNQCWKLLQEVKLDSQVIITSDHGEAFYEDGEHFYHHEWGGYTKEVMDIPFALYFL